MKKSKKIGDAVYDEQLSIVTDMILEQWVSCAHSECKNLMKKAGITESLTPDEIMEKISDNGMLKSQLISFLFGQMTLCTFDYEHLKFYKDEAERRLDEMLPEIPKF